MRPRSRDLRRTDHKNDFSSSENELSHLQYSKVHGGMYIFKIRCVNSEYRIFWALIQGHERLNK